MLSDFNGAEKVYIACGYTDLRRSIDGLAGIVRQQFQLDPYRYLAYIFRTAPNLDRSAADWVTPLLPTNAPPECKSVH